MATVLVLDGDEISLLTLQDILETFGHSLVPVYGAEAALELVRERSYDLILIDVLRPGLDPVALTRALVAARAGTRVVALTAYPKEPLAGEILAAGAHSLMRKPYEVGRILHLLEGQP